jgi:hypothetical protein
MMITEGRAEGLHSAGFPVGCALTRARGQAVTGPAPATSSEGRSAAKASLHVGVRDRTVEEAKGSGVEQFPAGTFQRAEHGSGETSSQADALDAEGEERGGVDGVR